MSAALFQLLPTAACTPTEALSGQLHREACYAALGIGACELQTRLSYAQMLAASVSEAEALLPAAEPPVAAPPQPPTRPPLAAALQARLCWLLSCWWAFGGSGDEAEDERLSGVSYTLLCRMLHAGADVAVRLQAAQVLHALLRGCGKEDARVFSPHAPHTLAGLASTLACCTEDDACLWVLRTMRTLTRRVPAAAFGAPALDVAAGVLGSVWQRAKGQRRPLLLAALKRVADAMSAAK